MYHHGIITITFAAVLVSVLALLAALALALLVAHTCILLIIMIIRPLHPYRSLPRGNLDAQLKQLEQENKPSIRPPVMPMDSSYITNLY
jgi:hypothetical protein